MFYDSNEPTTIQNLFNSIALNYDRANAVLSLRMHERWNRALVRQAIIPYAPETLLDLCCGTGEIAFNYLKQALAPCHVHLLDFSEQMLICAQNRAKSLPFTYKHRLNFIHADAQVLPLPDTSIGCTTIAYGIRNVQNPAYCFSEVFRVLRPGGILGILELTRPHTPLLRLGHKIYLKAIIPWLGWCCSANQDAYRYLSRSIQDFIEPAELASALNTSGFKEVSIIPLSGGIATILVAKKPLS